MCFSNWFWGVWKVQCTKSPDIPVIHRISHLQVSQRVLAFFEDWGLEGSPTCRGHGHGPNFDGIFLRIQTFTDRQLVFVYIFFFQRLSPLFGRMFFIECTSILSKLILDQRTLRWRWREFQKMGHILLILDRCVQDDEVIISIFDQNPVSFIEFVVVVSNMLFCFKPVWGKFPFLTRLFQFRVEATTSWIVSSRDIPLC